MQPIHYIDQFNTIRHAQEEDTVRIILNTRGGVLATALQFIRVMGESKAHIITSIEGDCMSAGTMIFLAGHEFEIAAHSSIMIHNYTGGIIGKAHEIHSQSDFQKQWATDFYNDIYDQFLTKEEIDLVLSGKDLYMTTNEAALRCDKLLTYREELAELIQEEYNNE
jgi:ATP-dependent protease ClpP protease subunit